MSEAEQTMGSVLGLNTNIVSSMSARGTPNLRSRNTGRDGSTQIILLTLCCILVAFLLGKECRLDQGTGYKIARMGR
jgi:hypothetical protein